MHHCHSLSRCSGVWSSPKGWPEAVAAPGSRQSRSGSNCGTAKHRKVGNGPSPSSGPVLPCRHPRRYLVMPKCPKNAVWPRQNVTTLNQNVRYLNQNVRFFSVNLFCDHLFSIGYRLCSEIFFIPPTVPDREHSKFDTGNSKLKAVSSFQFPISNFEFPRAPAGRPAGRRQASFLLRPWGKARGGAAAERVRGSQEPREPTRLRHSEQKTHLHPIRLAIFMPLSYGLSTKRLKEVCIVISLKATLTKPWPQERTERHFRHQEGISQTGHSARGSGQEGHQQAPAEARAIPRAQRIPQVCAAYYEGAGTRASFEFYKQSRSQGGRFAKRHVGCSLPSRPI